MYQEKNKVYGNELKVRVAAVQMDVQLGEKEANVDKTLARINEAADRGAKLIILPEMINSGYMFNTKEEAMNMAEPIPDGYTVTRWAKAAKERDVYIVGGLPEQEDSNLYNAAVLIGPDGYIGKYRKMHLWDEDKIWYEPGNLGIPVFNTPIGKIAIIICYDMWFSEMWRIAKLKGADIVCVPTNWLKIDIFPEDLQTMAPTMAQAAANTNNLWIACADRAGEERGTIFPGRSLIVNPYGLPVSGIAGFTEETIKYADCNFADARLYNMTPHNVAYRDRRTDYYDEMLGSGEKKCPF